MSRKKKVLEPVDVKFAKETSNLAKPDRIEHHIDNMSAKALCENTELKRTKHLDIKWMYARQVVKERKVKMSYVNTKLQKADVLTKALLKSDFKRLVELINGSQ